MSIKTKLIEEFENQLEEVGKMSVGTDEYKTVVDGVTKLADRIIDIEKFESDNRFREDTLLNEIVTKEQQLKDEKHDRFVKNCIAIGVPVASLLTTGLAFVASMNFEKNGHIFSTEGGRSALKRLLKF